MIAATRSTSQARQRIELPKRIEKAGENKMNTTE